MNIPMPRPMLSEEEKNVRILHKLCHPGVPEPRPFWYFVHPTLVVNLDNNIVGSTSFCITIAPGFGSTMYGKDLCVHPQYRGNGIAECLHAARLTIGQQVGVTTFMGVTSKHNKKMASILKRSGMHECVPIGDDLLFIGPILEV